MNLIARSANACSLFMHRLACGLVLPALTLLLVADITCRNLLGSAVYWASEASGLLLLCLFFLALPRMVQQGKLLRMDLLPLPASITAHPVAGRILAGLGPLMVTLFSLLLIVQSGLSLHDTLRYDERAFTLPLPLWPFHALMLISSVLLFVHALDQLITSCAGEAS